MPVSLRFQLDQHALRRHRVHSPSDIVGRNGQLAIVFSIDKDKQFDSGRPAKSDHRIESCPDGSTREQYIVNQDHIFPLYDEVDPVFAGDSGAFPAPKVIPMECDVQVSQGD